MLQNIKENQNKVFVQNELTKNSKFAQKRFTHNFIHCLILYIDIERKDWPLFLIQKILLPKTQHLHLNDLCPQRHWHFTSKVHALFESTQQMAKSGSVSCRLLLFQYS
jgi:hypothetical protein